MKVIEGGFATPKSQKLLSLFLVLTALLTKVYFQVQLTH